MSENSIHLLRWEEIPDFPLYMDQVINLVESSLSFMKLDDDDKIVTSTMINNYVKSKIVSAPIKKKYVRNHVAYFIVICLLKKVYSLEDISKLIKVQFDHAPTASAYDQFCDVFEELYRGVDEPHDYTVSLEIQNLFCKTIMSVVYTISVEQAIHNEKTIAEVKKEEEKKRKKKD